MHNTYLFVRVFFEPFSSSHVSACLVFSFFFFANTSHGSKHKMESIAWKWMPKSLENTQIHTKFSKCDRYTDARTNTNKTDKKKCQHFEMIHIICCCCIFRFRYHFIVAICNNLLSIWQMMLANTGHGLKFKDFQWIKSGCVFLCIKSWSCDRI